MFGRASSTLHAIPPESSVGTGKISILANCPHFAPWSNFWWFFGRLECHALLCLGLVCIAPKSVSGACARHSIRIKRWNRINTSISKMPSFCSLEQLLVVFGRLECDALLRLGLVQSELKSVYGAFARHSI